MEYLILLNRKFPYKSGETFLENEIEEIANQFDKIIIFPSDVCKTDSITRKIYSKNVDCIVMETTSLKQRQISYVCNSFFNLPMNSGRIISNFIDGYFLSAVKSQSKKIIEKLSCYDFKTNDTIYLYSYWLYINAGVACQLKKYFFEKGINVKTFSRAHGFDIYEERRKYNYLPCRKELFNNLDRVFPCSDDGTKYLKNKFSNYSNKIKTSYLGTYDHGIRKYEVNEVFHIVSCSRMSKVKRVELIVEALSQINTKRLIKWTHIGSGEEFEKIKNMASSKLKKIDVQLIGSISNEEVYNFYLNNNVDLFINVSSSEGLPVSIMEATSFGIPVIATNAGGTGEIVINDVSGKLIEINFETKELASLISEFSEKNENSYIKLRTSTRSLWEEKYQAPKNYVKFVSLVKEI